MAATVQQLVTALIDRIYPVGVIIGFAQDIDPNKQIGGGGGRSKTAFCTPPDLKRWGPRAAKRRTC